MEDGCIMIVSLYLLEGCCCGFRVDYDVVLILSNAPLASLLQLPLQFQVFSFRRAQLKQSLASFALTAKIFCAGCRIFT
eukprot:scaffold64904_cov23-Cyclotella_meneghiniana.AAC.1